MSTRCRLMSAAVASALAVVVGSAALADDAKCRDAVYKTARNVGNQEQKGNGACIKGGAACTGTTSPKASDQAGKLAALFNTGGKCDPVPAFGTNPGGPSVISQGIIDGSDNIILGIFGDPPTGVAAGDKCQQAIAKRTGKKYDTQLKAFRTCGKTAASAGALDACVGTAVNDQKAVGVQGKLASDMGKKCTFNSPPAGLETGDCASCTDAATCAACIGDIVDCNACLAMNGETGGSADCDLIDDGSVNGSCGAPPPPACQPGGIYTQTTTGGGLRVGSFAPFPFPAGGTTVQHVGDPDADCVHDVVIPNGGLTVPPFCVPALGATTQVTQTGCGVGKIDSNGGSDFTVDEKGDTSEGGVCGVTQGSCPLAGPAPDSSGRLDVTVGNGSADSCAGGGLGNAVVSIPVNTLTWVAADLSCPDSDSTYDVGTDTQLAEFPQTLDLTTDSAVAIFTDIDSDGCLRSGAGPNSFANQNGLCVGAGDPMSCCTGAGVGPCPTVIGNCIDFGAGTVSVAASGAIFNSGGPTYDLLFATVQNATISGPSGAASATCGTPPVINFSGAATRCLVAP